MRVINLLAEIPPAAAEERIEALWQSGGCRVERIVSYGQSSPPDFWYDQNEAEWVLLLAGTAMLEFEPGGGVELVAGDCLSIPAHLRHRVVRTSSEPPAVWLAVFGPGESSAGV